jgi:serine phosphatase RsbU (regulator of sigma subunit)
VLGLLLCVGTPVGSPGAQLAGALLPAYEVGGDSFDFVENRDGAWLARARPVER